MLHASGCPHARPTDVTRLDVLPGYGAFPVWGWFTLPARPGVPAREVHGNTGPRSLGLSDALAAELQEWSIWQDRRQAGPALPQVAEVVEATGAEWAQWRAAGKELAGRLARETGAAVVYLWPSEGRDSSCAVCGKW
ncbi:hypothetical protein Aco03nite_082640 [Actinoplanes couchii]|uniref:Uncharacterized protein n=1 Tax=Actinoplanes couchii TaxID=403638 RepID=A0ABQ3XMX0_9ACTN|nr:hypothetical protein Aco03nite_082640 [Actinoplanes couchii]